MQQPTIILFDVDGTLINSGNAGRRALEHAFIAELNATNGLEFSFAGMTDRAIVRRGLAASGVEPTDGMIQTVLDRYLGFLPNEIEDAEDYRVFEGIHDVLTEVKPHAHIAVGLGTGNVERGAKIKLRRAALDASFSFGGFGCDNEQRDRLLAVGAQRGARLLGRECRDCRVVVIGDTPKDVAAAQAIGAESVAVATGPYSTTELANLGASRVCATLAEAAICDWIIHAA